MYNKKQRLIRYLFITKKFREVPLQLPIKASLLDNYFKNLHYFDTKQKYKLNLTIGK